MPSTLTSCEANLEQSIVFDKMIKIQAIDKICLYVPLQINLLSAKRMRQALPTGSVKDSGVPLYSEWGRCGKPPLIYLLPHFQENWIHSAL